MTDQIAHILILVFVAAIVGGIAAAMLIGRARLRKSGNLVLPADPHPMRFDDSARLDTVNSVIDRASHGS